jgi:hypothetical protein
MAKPHAQMTLPQLKAYIRTHKLNKPEVRLGMKKADMVAGLKKIGHWDYTKDKNRPKLPPRTVKKAVAKPPASQAVKKVAPKKAPAKKVAPKKVAPKKVAPKKVKIDFDDLYAGGASESGEYINDMTDPDADNPMSFAKARAKVRKLLVVYNKTASPTIAGAYAYLKEQNAPKKASVKKVKVNNLMRLSVYDYKILDDIIETWYKRKRYKFPMSVPSGKVNKMKWIDKHIGEDWKQDVPKGHSFTDAEVLSDWKSVFSHRKELQFVVPKDK